MTEPAAPGTADTTVGARVLDAGGAVIGTVDAVFADYLLVRTRGFLPVDLYVPVSEVGPAEGNDGGPASVRVMAADADAAYRAWHRPLKQAPHP